jgi:hypothetical protein
MASTNLILSLCLDLYFIRRAQFARRDAVYYASPIVRKADAFLITCTISSSPVPVNRIPTPVSSQISVPSFLIDTIGSLLNDPAHSDVEFLLPHRGRGLRGARSILASKKILSRFPYFETSETSHACSPRIDSNIQ